MDKFDLFKKLSHGVSFKRREAQLPQIREVSTARVKAEHIHSEPISQEIKVEEDEKAFSIDVFEGVAVKEEPTKVKKKKEPLTEEKLLKIKEEHIAHQRNLFNIAVKGKNVPPLIETFEELSLFGVGPKVLRNIAACGYTSPTPIQMQAIPAMLNAQEVLACAPTGSGKTAAFLIPTITHLGKTCSLGFRALILCPTRELARQTYRECLRLIEGTGLKAHIIGKVADSSTKFGPNFSTKFDILISTPNRLLYLMRREETVISLTRLQWLIVDECDKLFEDGATGFRDQLAEIYAGCDSKQLKRAMFSATYMAHLAKWCKKNLKGLISITIGQRNTTVEDVEQQLLYVGKEHGKLLAFRQLVQEGFHPPVLVFVQSKERAKELVSELLYDGINVDVIHSDRTQLQRDNVVRAFREGKIWVLICTELMGRGIDFKGVKLVINYDFPPTAVSYIHRIGRTGRAGRPGKAITFFTEDDKPSLRSIAHVMRESGCEVPEFMLSLKKMKRSEKKKLESTVPKRKKISTSIGYENMKVKRLKQLKEATKRRKTETSGGASTEKHS